MTNDFDPTPEERRIAERLRLAQDDIAEFVEREQCCTVGAIKREFPDYVDIIWSCLHSLKLDEKLDFDESAAPPTKVTAKAMKRIRPMIFTSSSTYKKKEIVPDSAAVYGKENAF